MTSTITTIANNIRITVEIVEFIDLRKIAEIVIVVEIAIVVEMEAATVSGGRLDVVLPQCVIVAVVVGVIVEVVVVMRSMHHQHLLAVLVSVVLQ